MQQDTADNRTLTQRVISAIGTHKEVAELITTKVGYRITRQAITKWYAQGALPFQGADTYAGILSRAARAKSFDVTKDDLLDEVQVPADRMPRATPVAQ